MAPSRLLQIGWRVALTIALLLLMLAISLRTNTQRAGAQSGNDPLVLAFYYSWYDDATWTSGTLSDLPAQRYASADRAAMGRHIDQAKAAGIDAFVVAWYGPGGGNQTESNLAALLEEAAARNFRIAILFESDSPFMRGSGEATAALQHAMATHAQQPAFLRVEGRPVFFFWRTQRYGIDAWRAMRDAADPSRAALWIADGVDTSYLALFDGHHLYSNTWNPAANLESVNRKFAGQVESYRQSSGAARIWVATVMPGYNDVRARAGGFAQDREGGAYYDRSWAAALASTPNWVVVTSFNEWPEGSFIEPSEGWGDYFLGATAAWSGRFKQGGGQALNLAPVAVALPAAALPVAAAEATYDAPTLLVETALLNIRGGPGTDFPLVGTAAAGAALSITGRSAGDAAAAESSSAESAADAAWWQVAYGDQVGWASGEFGRAVGPLEGVPLLTQDEDGAATRTATVASGAGEVVLLSAPADAVETAEAIPLQAPVGGWSFGGPQPLLSPRP